MKEEADRIWEQLEAEARMQEKRVENLVIEVPAGARSQEEFIEDLMEKIRELGTEF